MQIYKKTCRNKQLDPAPNHQNAIYDLKIKDNVDPTKYNHRHIKIYRERDSSQRLHIRPKKIKKKSLNN